MALCLWCIQCYACMCNYKCAFANSIYVHVYGCVSVCSFGVFYPELMADDNVDSQSVSLSGIGLLPKMVKRGQIFLNHTPCCMPVRFMHDWGKVTHLITVNYDIQIFLRTCVCESPESHQCVVCPWDSCMTGEKWLTWITVNYDIQIFLRTCVCESPESHTSVLYAREIHAWLGESDSPELQWIMNQSWRVRICVFISFSLSVHGHVSCIWNPGM